MDLFKVVYYPNSDCHPLVLKKAILAFDELVFFDHSPISFSWFGSKGHRSHMEHHVDEFRREGYNMRVVEPQGGPVEGELQRIIDADLANQDYCNTFFRLMKNDPKFLIDMVGRSHGGDFGKYGSSDGYKNALLQVKPSDIPSRLSEIDKFKPNNEPLPPEIAIVLKMALDSHQLNFAAYTATQDNLHLFGDSRGMSMMLDAKFKPHETPHPATTGLAHKVAFTLLERTIPNEAFQNKKVIDVIRFRNEMSVEREKFQERVLKATVEMQGISGDEQQKKLNEIVFAELLPEVRDYQEKFAKKWDVFFKESAKSVLRDSHHTAELVATLLPMSFSGALLAGALELSTKVVPHLINYLKDKESLNRSNPYVYLMKFQ